MASHYKDSLFRSLFSDSTELRELYNILTGANYDETAEVITNTLSETLFTMRKNDISFTIDNKLIVLIEHQSTINQNMPFRFLMYIARLLENSIPNRDAVYRQQRLGLPYPEFIVLYNGIDPFPERSEMRLSDAFKEVPGHEQSNLELIVTVYNLNNGAWEESETLYGYVLFVNWVRRYMEEHKDAEVNEAVAAAIAYCRANGILADFFSNLTPEEENMLAMEWNLEDALRVTREEALEEGIERGREKGIEEGRTETQRYVLELLDKGYSTEEIKKHLIS
jgi:predicted transposase/invertase (TIGR01784 family)